MLFLLKITLPPILVGVMSMAARRWGPTVGGLIMGLPWMTGPVLFFLAWDKGEAFGVSACTGIELGVVCVSAFMLAYGAMTAIAPWPLCLAAAAAAFFGTAWATQGLPLSLFTAAGAAILGLCACHVLLPRPRAPAVLSVLPPWDIPVRMLVTLMLVAIIMLTADAMGPRLSGIIATYPVVVTVIGTFTHHQWGRDAVRSVLRGVTLSLFAFVAFFVVVGLTLPAVGLVASFLLACVTAVNISAITIALHRRHVL